MSELQNAGVHSIVLDCRKNISVSGVKGVNGFSDEHISILTVADETLIIEGNDLVVEEVNLERGSVSASGTVSSVIYDDNTFAVNKKSGILGRVLFRK